MQQDISYRFPLRLPHPERESALGYLKRLAADFGHLSTDSMLARIDGFETLSDLLDKTDARPVAEACGIEAAQFDSRRWRRCSQETVTNGSHVLPESAVQKQKVSFCRSCLADQPHHRFEWFLSALQVCPDHRERLASRCGVCERQIMYSDPGMARCTCGASLADGPKIPATQEESEAAEVIVALLYGAPPRPDLHGLGLAETLQLSEVLGRLALEAWEGQSAHGQPSLEQVSQRLGVGIRILRGWPEEFPRFLKARATRVSGTRRQSLQTILGPLHRLATAAEESPGARLLRHSIEAFVVDNPDVSLSPQSPFMPAVLRAQGFISRDEACAELELDEAEFRKLIRTSRGRRIHTAKACGEAFFHGEQVARLAAERRDAIPLETAVAALGLDHPADTDFLEQSGLLASLQCHRPPHRRFSHEKIQTFLNGLCDHQAANGGAGFTWADLRQRAEALDLSLTDVLELLKDGRLRARTPGDRGVGLQRLRFGPEAAGTLEALRGEQQRLLSLREAARHCQMQFPVLAALVSQGHIPPAEASRRGVRLSKRALIDFQRNAVSLTRLARDAGMAPTTALARLGGIAPVAAVGDSAAATFYSKKAAREALHRASHTASQIFRAHR